MLGRVLTRREERTCASEDHETVIQRAGRDHSNGVGEDCYCEETDAYGGEDLAGFVVAVEGLAFWF